MNTIKAALAVLKMPQRALASELAVTPQAVNQWCNGERPIPEDKCPAIERLANGQITCEQLRADTNWVRIADEAWPYHPDGRPLIDPTKPRSV